MLLLLSRRPWRLCWLMLLLVMAGQSFYSCIAQAQNQAQAQAQAPMNESEKEALSTVLNLILGESWNGGQQYPDPCGSTPIQGVDCDQFGDFWHVTVLYIGTFYDNSPRCSASATIHPALFNLVYLKRLIFDTCFTSATVMLPAHGWKNLTSLRSLTFRSNSALLGPIPAEFGDLVGLESLVVLDTGIGGYVPKEIGYLSKLKSLVLSHNNLSGPLPESFSRLDRLLILDLSFNGITGELGPGLGKLSSLVKLDLSNNNITGQLPESFGALKNITLLDLRNNRLAGGLPRSLADMSRLQELYLGNNPLGAQMLLDWNKLGSLTSLDLSKCSIQGRIPEVLGRVKALRYVALDGNRLWGTVPAALAELPSLNVLYLNGNSLSGQVDFPENFWRRMGRRLALWNNPGLCVVAGQNSQSHGLKPCFQSQTTKAKEGTTSSSSSSTSYVPYSPAARLCFSHSLLGFLAVGLLLLSL